MKMRKLLSVLLSFCALFTITTNSFAFELNTTNVTLAPESNITYKQLPSHIRSMVNNGDLVLVDENEHYYIIPATLNTTTAPSVNDSQNSRALVYSPDGGTYTFTNPILSSDASTITYLLNVSYIPVVAVIRYLINTNDTSLLGVIRDIFLSIGATEAAKYLEDRLGIVVSATIISAVISVAQWYINYTTYNAIKAAYNTYCPEYVTGGLLTETRYIHNKLIGSGNIVTTFSSWNSGYVNNVHYGLTGTLSAGVYYAGGTALVIPEQ